MRISVPFTIALIALALPATAQEVAAPSASKAPEVRRAEAVKPGEATPAPKKRGFFDRIFGKKDRPEPASASPAPATPAPATPTPKPKPKSRKQETAERESEPTRETPVKPVAEPPSSTASEAKPESSEKTASTSKRGKKGSKTAAAAESEEKKPEEAKTPEQIALEKAIASGDEDAIEKAKYDEVKSRAVQDKKIQELKAKADAAPTDAEGRKALRAYNKALFQKMRSLDSSIRGRVDRMETAVLKRLEPSGQ